jgi:hypothetical protein
MERDPMKDSITQETFNTVSESQTRGQNYRNDSTVIKTNEDMTNILTSKNVSTKLTGRASVEIKTQGNGRLDSIIYEN